MTTYPWIWEPQSVLFNPNYFSHAPEVGKQQHVFGDPFWVFEWTLPPKKDTVRRQIESFLAKLEGAAVLDVYDPRVPIPSHYKFIVGIRGASESIIPDVTIKAMTRSDSTITISGDVGDVIKTGDPLAFTDSVGMRHYFKSHDDLVLDGSDQSLAVFLRPRKTLTGLNIVMDRIRPTNRFIISPNEIGGRTNSDSHTNYMIQGVEFVFAITP